MLEARMHRAGVDQGSTAELLDTAQTLELRRVNEPKLVARQFDVAVDGITKDAQATQASPPRSRIHPWPEPRQESERSRTSNLHNMKKLRLERAELAHRYNAWVTPGVITPRTRGIKWGPTLLPESVPPPHRRSHTMCYHAQTSASHQAIILPPEGRGRRRPSALRR